MLQYHSLKVVASGETKTLQEWGFHAAQMDSDGSGRDVLTLVAERTPQEGALFAMHAAVQLLDNDGAVRLDGIVRLPRGKASGTVRSQTYIVEGVLSWKMGRRMFRQLWNLASVDTTTGTVSYTTELLTRLVLFKNKDGEKLNLKEQVEEILEYAQGLGIDFDYDTSCLPEVQPQPDEQLDLRIWDALETALAWAPEVSRYVDYSGARPKLYFARAAAIDGIEVDVPDEAGFELRSLNLNDLEDYEYDPRDDLLVPTVRINYLRPVKTIVDTGETRVPLAITRDTSTVANGAYGESESTVLMSTIHWNGAIFVSEDETAPASGLAKSLHEGFARLAFELRFRRPLVAMEWDYKPGELWNISGAGSNEATAFAVCQTVSRDLGNCMVSIRTGLRSSLSLSGRLQLLRPNRKRQVPENDGTRQYGFGKEDKEEVAPGGGGAGAYRQPLEPYDDGTWIQVKPGKLCGEAPEIVDGAGDWKFAPAEMVIYLKVKINKSTHAVVERKLMKGVTLPVGTEDATTVTGYLELGTVTFDGTNYQVEPAYIGSRWAALVPKAIGCGVGTSLAITWQLLWS